MNETTARRALLQHLNDAGAGAGAQIVAAMFDVQQILPGARRGLMELQVAVGEVTEIAVVQ